MKDWADLQFLSIPNFYSRSTQVKSVLQILFPCCHKFLGGSTSKDRPATFQSSPSYLHGSTIHCEKLRVQTSQKIIIFYGHHLSLSQTICLSPCTTAHNMLIFCSDNMLAPHLMPNLEDNHCLLPVTAYLNICSSLHI